MNARIDDPKIDLVRQTIRDVVERRFSGKVSCVSVEPYVDADGDDVIKVTVVLKDGVRDLDNREMIGLARHLRSHIEQTDAFPLISFVSNREAKKLGVEAA